MAAVDCLSDLICPRTVALFTTGFNIIRHRSSFVVLVQDSLGFDLLEFSVFPRDLQLRSEEAKRDVTSISCGHGCWVKREEEVDSRVSHRHRLLAKWQRTLPH